MGRKDDRFVYWTPRILPIAFILFLSLFSLDVFSMGLNAWETAVGLFMHNIPVFILLAVLIISWRYEIVCGIAFILAGLLYIAMVFRNPFELYMLSYSLIIAGPAFVIGTLFVIGWLKERAGKKVISRSSRRRRQ